MRRTLISLIIITGLLLTIFSSNAQIPPPVDLKIQNITQQNQMWCWAASAQQIIYWLRGNSPAQCELVAIANNTVPAFCCGAAQNCNVPGGFQQIQSLILQYGGHYSSIALPANPSIIYNTLYQGKAIILFLQTNQQIGHYVVLTGMAWVNRGFGMEPVFYLNDPMSVYTTPVLFSNLVSIWAAAIVVY